ncbi:MAG: hypothetical protein GY715_01105 [Planctomycetes bacterium]|nr:hypothetical protein [Planctomycetota bacterium]
MRRSIRTATLIGAALLTASMLAASTLAAEDPPPPYEGHRLVRTEIRTAEQLRTMMDISPDCWCETPQRGTLDFRVPPDAMAKLERSGIEHRVLVENLQATVDAERLRLLARDAAEDAAGPGGGSWYDDFRNLADIVTRLNDLAAAHPAIMQMIDIGDSLEGRDIWAARITGPGTGKPAVLYNSCQHAREWISPMTTMYILEHLVTQYGTDPQVTALVDAVEFFVIPIVNPDGYEWSWTDERFWRKNRRDNGDGTMGVDLNRNWGYEWGGNGAEPFPGDPLYHGPAPFSEPETQVMRDFYIAHPNLVASIDFHNYGQLVLWPWAYGADPVNDGGVHAAIGDDVVDAIYGVNGLLYEHGPIEDTLYPASGASVDWTWGDQGVFSYTVELRPLGSVPGFAPPPEEILPTAMENLAGALALADAATTGVLFDYPTGMPDIVPAGVSTSFEVTMTPVAASLLDPSSASLRWRLVGDDTFSVSPLTALGGNLYEATMPAVACGQSIEFYFRISTLIGTPYTDPPTAPVDLYARDVFEITTTFADDFETNVGWTLEHIDLDDGPWVRGVPIGGGDRGDPPTDFDGSGTCYLTDNVDGNSDVDGGPTRVISPVLDLSTLTDPHLSYARWFTSDDVDDDRLDVELSDDGGASWELVESVPGSSGWVTRTVRIGDYVTPTATVQVRFGATDNPSNSVAEAGLDAVRFFDIGCSGSIAGDVNGDGVVNFGDVLQVIGAWGPCGPPCPEDLSGNGIVGFEDILLVIGNWSG